MNPSAATALFERAGAQDPRAAAVFYCAAIDGFAVLPLLGSPLPSGDRLAQAAVGMLLGKERKGP